jgi:hypothetical protein
MAWHATIEYRMLLVSQTGVVHFTTLHAPIPIAWHPFGHLQLAYGKQLVREPHTPQTHARTRKHRDIRSQYLNSQATPTPVFISQFWAFLPRHRHDFHCSSNSKRTQTCVSTSALSCASGPPADTRSTYDLLSESPPSRLLFLSQERSPPIGPSRRVLARRT